MTRTDPIRSFSLSRNIAVACLALWITAGCGGGAKTEQNPVTSGPNAPSSYNGPPPATADIQAFKINLWDNIKGNDRCGRCHYAGNQTPMFARSDDINLA